MSSKKTFLIFTLFLAGFLFFNVSSASAATLYYNYPSLDNDWNTLENWWTDAGSSSQASSLPTVSDDVIFTGYVNVNNGPDASVNTLTVNGNGTIAITVTVANGATFNNTSANTGTIIGNVTFYNTSYNNAGSIITGDAIFYNSSYNDGTISNDATFYDLSSNWHTVTGQATFTYASGGTITLTDGQIWGNVGTAKDVDGNSIIHFIFNGSSANLGTVTTGTIFNGSSGNFGTVLGDAVFNDTSYNGNEGVISNDAVFNDESKNFAGTISNDAVFHDASYNGATVSGDAVFDYATGGIITLSGNQEWGTVVGTIKGVDDVLITEFIFTDESRNGGVISGDVSFYDSSSNTGTINGNATFYGGLSYDNWGTISGDKIRHFTTSLSTDLNFIQGGPWIVVADGAGVIVDVSAAVFDDSTIFQTLNEGSFTGVPLNLYWYNDGLDANWDTLEGNWWTDLNHAGGYESPTLPAEIDTVVTLGDVGPEVDLDVWDNPASIDASNTGISFISVDGYSPGIDITGDAIFNGISYNENTVNGNVTFYDSTYNDGTITGNGIFYGSSYNYFLVENNATFYNVSFNDSEVIGDATFYNSSYNNYTIYGNASFNDESINYGTIEGNACFVDIDVQNQGTVNGDISVCSLLVAPTVTTFSVSSVARNSVTLNGEIINIGGENVTERGFNYGLTDIYGTTVTQSSGPYSTGVFTTDLIGLTCGTTYHYRTFATNTAGTGVSADASFATSGCPSSGSSSGSMSTKTKALKNTIIPPTIPKTTPPALTYNFGTTTLRKGSSGEAVKELQRFLNTKLNLGLIVDGKLGPKTIAVIKKWQLDNGLVPDGLVGPKTKAKMNTN